MVMVKKDCCGSARGWSPAASASASRPARRWTAPAASASASRPARRRAATGPAAAPATAPRRRPRLEADAFHPHQRNSASAYRPAGCQSVAATVPVPATIPHQRYPRPHPERPGAERQPARLPCRGSGPSGARRESAAERTGAISVRIPTGPAPSGNWPGTVKTKLKPDLWPELSTDRRRATFPDKRLADEAKRVVKYSANGSPSPEGPHAKPQNGPWCFPVRAADQSPR